MVCIFDIDSLVYESCNKDLQDFEEVTEDFWGRYNDAVHHLEKRYKKVSMINVGFCKENYRKVVDSNYKAQRNTEKPPFFYELIEHIKETINVRNRRGIETDDLVVKYHKYYGKDKSIIVSIDKDYNQLECTIFNYRKRTFSKISKSESIFNFYEQMVIGDTADNVNYCKGYGNAWVKKNLVGKNEYALRRAVFSLFKKIYKSKGKEMYIKCLLLLKLDVF